MLLAIISNIENRKKSLYAYTLLLTGRIYSDKGYIKKSNNFVKQAAKIFNKINDENGLVNCYNLLGCNNTERSNLIEAVGNFNKCLLYTKRQIIMNY